MNKQKQRTVKFPRTKDKLKIFIAWLFFFLLYSKTHTAKWVSFRRSATSGIRKRRMRERAQSNEVREENKFNNNQLKIRSFLHFPFRYRNNQILNPPFLREHTSSIFSISLLSSFFLSNLFEIFCQYKSYTFLTNVKSTVASRNVYTSPNIRLKVLRSLWKHTHAWKRFLKSLKLIELVCTFQLFPS